MDAHHWQVLLVLIVQFRSSLGKCLPIKFIGLSLMDLCSSSPVNIAIVFVSMKLDEASLLALFLETLFYGALPMAGRGYIYSLDIQSTQACSSLFTG